MSDRRLDVGGLRLAVRERGSGHPLLLVNGLGGNVDMWGTGPGAPVRARAHDRLRRPRHGPLADRARCRCRSRPSRGVIVRLLDELGHERVDVLGYSWGGLAAQQLARSAPERVRRLALAGTSCGWGGVPGDLRALALLATPLRYYSQTFYERTSHLLDGTEGSGAHDGHSRAHADARRANPPSLRGYWSQVLAGSAYTSLPWLHRIAGADARRLRPVRPARPARQRRPARARAAATAGSLLVPGEGHLLLFDPASAALPVAGRVLR